MCSGLEEGKEAWDGCVISGGVGPLEIRAMRVRQTAKCDRNMMGDVK